MVISIIDSITSAPLLDNRSIAAHLLSTEAKPVPLQVLESIMLTAANLQQLAQILPKETGLSSLVRHLLTQANRTQTLLDASHHQAPSRSESQGKLTSSTQSPPDLIKVKIETTPSQENKTLPYLLKLSGPSAMASKPAQWFLSQDSVDKGEFISIKKINSQLVFSHSEKSHANKALKPTELPQLDSSKTTLDTHQRSEKKRLIEHAFRQFVPIKDDRFTFVKQLYQSLPVRRELVALAKHELNTLETYLDASKTNDNSKKAVTDTLKSTLKGIALIDRLNTVSPVQTQLERPTGNDIKREILASGQFFESKLSQHTTSRSQVNRTDISADDLKASLLSLLDIVRSIASHAPQIENNRISKSLNTLLDSFLLSLLGSKKNHLHSKSPDEPQSQRVNLEKLEISLLNAIAKVSTNQLITALLNENPGQQQNIIADFFVRIADAVFPITYSLQFDAKRNDKKTTEANRNHWKIFLEWRMGNDAYSSEILLENQIVTMKLWCGNARVRKKFRENTHRLISSLRENDINIQGLACVESNPKCINQGLQDQYQHLDRLIDIRT